MNKQYKLIKKNIKMRFTLMRNHLNVENLLENLLVYLT